MAKYLGAAAMRSHPHSEREEEPAEERKEPAGEFVVLDSFQPLTLDDAQLVESSALLNAPES